MLSNTRQKLLTLLKLYMFARILLFPFWYLNKQWIRSIDETAKSKQMSPTAISNSSLLPPQREEPTTYNSLAFSRTLQFWRNKEAEIEKQKAAIKDRLDFRGIRQLKNNTGDTLKKFRLKGNSTDTFCQCKY